MDTAFIFHMIAVVLVLAGLAGIVLPALPGVPLVFAGLLLSAWADGFHHVGWPMLLVLAGLTLLSLLVDVAATALGAKGVGASRLAIAGALAGTVAGLFFMPIGLLAGPFVGAWLGEYWHGRHLGRATAVGLGTWLGIVLGTASKLAIALAMLVLFALAWWR
jgi:uncharacterized protein YqgC (DUF456 family)